MEPVGKYVQAKKYVYIYIYIGVLVYTQSIDKLPLLSVYICIHTQQGAVKGLLHGGVQAELRILRWPGAAGVRLSHAGCSAFIYADISLFSI